MCDARPATAKFQSLIKSDGIDQWYSLFSRSHKCIYDMYERRVFMHSNIYIVLHTSILYGHKHCTDSYRIAVICISTNQPKEKIYASTLKPIWHVSFIIYFSFVFFSFFIQTHILQLIPNEQLYCKIAFVPFCYSILIFNVTACWGLITFSRMNDTWTRLNDEHINDVFFLPSRWKSSWNQITFPYAKYVCWYTRCKNGKVWFFFSLLTLHFGSCNASNLFPACTFIMLARIITHALLHALLLKWIRNYFDLVCLLHDCI